MKNKNDNTQTESTDTSLNTSDNPENQTTASTNKDGKVTEKNLQKQGPTANPLGKATEENSGANVSKAKKQGFLWGIFDKTSIGIMATAAVVGCISAIAISPSFLIIASVSGLGSLGGYLGYKAVKDKYFADTKKKKLNMLGVAGSITLGVVSPIIGVIAGAAGVVSKLVGKRFNSSKANNFHSTPNNSPKIKSNSLGQGAGVSTTGPLPTQTPDTTDQRSLIQSVNNTTNKQAPVGGVSTPGQQQQIN